MIKITDNNVSLEILDNTMNIIKEAYHKDAILHLIIKKEIDLAYLDVIEALKKME